MKQLICEMCGSSDLLKQDGVFICQSCGCKYSVEDAKKMMVEVEGVVEVTGTVRVDNTSEIDNLLLRAKQFREAGADEKALAYYNMVLDIDANNQTAKDSIVEMASLYIGGVKVSAETLKTIKDYSMSGEKIKAISCVRNATGMGLAEAKEWVENYQRKLGVAPAVSSTSSQSSSGGCYVATAVYGSYDCPEVWTLRRFRDYTLAETWYGRAFIRTYYAISPTLVKWFGHTEWFKKLWRGKLDCMVANLNTAGIENTPYEDRLW